MKPKTQGWLFFGGAVLVAAGALFAPLPTGDSSVSVPSKPTPTTLASLMAWLLAAGTFWGFAARFWPNDGRTQRRLRNALLLLVLQAMLLRACFEFTSFYRPLAWPWLPEAAWVWMPWFLGPGLTGILLGGRYGVLAGLGSGLMFYLFADPGPWVLVGCTAAALAGVLLLRRSPTRGRVLRAGAATGGILGIVAACQYGLEGSTVDMIAAAVLVPLAVGVFAAFVVLSLLPLFEWLLGELSDVRLVEYGADHRLLDQLRTEAPGTWYHSLNVADLAEKAAAEIKARALFCKTAALYHDIGKLKEPGLFAENSDGVSPHDHLEPHVSAQKIIEHVSYGLELARKHRLPKAFREIIAEHHGGSVVRFFHAKACQPRADGSLPSVRRALFTYPGPPPSTRESGIIALADAVEAASRSLSTRYEPELRALVRNLIGDRIAEGELAQCPLTLADLAKVEAAFVSWLKSRHHHRPAYPGMPVGHGAPGPAQAPGIPTPHAP